MTENQKLSRAVEARQDEMVEMLARWIRIPSVEAEGREGAPFGPALLQMLEEAVRDGERLSLHPRNIDGYACDFEIGEGEETVAILAHLDVVPAGDGWQMDPFGAVIQEGRMYGRGTSDDKGPAVASMIAMRAILDAGIPLRKKLRLILGCDEESGWLDMEYYAKHVGIPETGFSPDADYPLINTEKGICQVRLRAEPAPDRNATFPLYAVQSGERPNVIPGFAQAEVGGDLSALRTGAAAFAKAEDVPVEIEELPGGHVLLKVTGVPGHAAMPSLGKNAASLLLRLLASLRVGGDVTGPIVQVLAQTTGGPYSGEGFGIQGEDGVSGPLTMNLGILSFDGGAWSLTLDIRYPVFYHVETLTRFIGQRLLPYGFAVEKGHGQAPHHVPESSPVVQKLLEVYRGLTGDQTPPQAIGGGTYARVLKQGVAFGVNFPGEIELAHQAGENVRLDHLLLNAKIIAHAIVALCG